VPNALVLDKTGARVYQLDYQHQSGFHQELAVTISATGARSPGVTVQKALTEDEIISVPQTCLQTPQCKPTITGGST
jgi:hypothetical protein